MDLLKSRLLFLNLIFCLFFIIPRCYGDGINHKSIIIDTDMGLDDARALAWFLSIHNIQIVGIITSDGALDPLHALNNLKITLEYFKKQEIPLCEGIHLKEPDPPFRATATAAFSSFPQSTAEFNLRKNQLFYEILTSSYEDHSLIYVCLGPMSNLAYAIDSIPGFTEKIEKVLYAGNAPSQDRMAWNTARDKVAAESVYCSLDNVYEFDIPDNLENFFQESVIQAILQSDNKVAAFYNKIHNLNASSDVNERHIFLFDDIIPLYLLNPEYFTLKSKDTGKYIKNTNKALLQSAYSNFIEDGRILSPRSNVVFKQYPIDRTCFRDDVGDFSEEMIVKYGLEEWKAAILTHEMHRHLGAYSVIGVKMGILAREILEADLDELTVVSYTGLNPPLSCLTDGLQIATGASLGRGTISIATASEGYPKALFISGSRKISIELKPEIIQRIQSDIISLSNQYGYGTQRYFEEIRRISIHFWVNLNRKHMFEVYDYMTDE